jgi:F-type H+-transporting ATPase subunit delta
MAEAATIARPYAKAAFTSARDMKALAAWSEALRFGSEFLAHSKVPDLLTDPKLDDDQLVAMFAGLGGNEIDAHWRNFIRLLAHNKRLHVLPEISGQFEMLRAGYENEVDVVVTSAVSLSEAHRAALTAALNQRFKRDVRMSTAVDPALLGGAVIRAGDLVIDGSISGRLRRLASELEC